MFDLSSDTATENRHGCKPAEIPHGTSCKHCNADCFFHLMWTLVEDDGENTCWPKVASDSRWSTLRISSRLPILRSRWLYYLDRPGRQGQNPVYPSKTDIFSRNLNLTRSSRLRVLDGAFGSRSDVTKGKRLGLILIVLRFLRRTIDFLVVSFQLNGWQMATPSRSC